MFGPISIMPNSTLTWDFQLLQRPAIFLMHVAHVRTYVRTYVGR